MDGLSRLAASTLSGRNGPAGDSHSAPVGVILA